MIPAIALGLILLGYLLGSIPFGLLIARAYGMDIRAAGSGNIGTTNVWRVLGWKPGLLVLVLDAAKGFGAVWLTHAVLWNLIPADERLYLGFCGNTSDGTASILATLRWLPMAVGLAAMLGHSFTPWLKFKGGKGIATGLGMSIALYQFWILVPLAVFVIVLRLTRMVSGGSIVAAMTLLGISFLPWSIGVQYYFDINLNPPRHLWPFGLLVLILVLWTHRGNIKRILNGTENKVSFGKKPKTQEA